MSYTPRSCSIMIREPGKSASGILALALLLLSSLIRCGLFPKEEEPTVPVLVEPVEQGYELYEVTRRDISRTVRGIGIVEPSVEHSLYFRKPTSRLSRIAVALGERVRKETPLVFLDTEELEDQITLQELKLRKARLQYERAQAVGSDRFSKEIAEIDVLTEEHALAMLRKQLDRSVLLAPADGVVIFIDHLEEGDFIEPYRPLVKIADPQTLHVIYQSAKTSEVRLGMPAIVRLDGRVHEGTVIYAAGDAPTTVDSTLRNAIIVSVPNLQEYAEIGDFVDLEVLIEKRESALVVPQSALRKYSDRVYVHVLTGDRKRESDVEIGIENYTEAEILSGVDEGQKVILR